LKTIEGEGGVLMHKRTSLIIEDGKVPVVYQRISVGGGDFIKNERYVGKNAANHQKWTGEKQGVEKTHTQRRTELEEKKK